MMTSDEELRARVAERRIEVALPDVVGAPPRGGDGDPSRARRPRAPRATAAVVVLGVSILVAVAVSRGRGPHAAGTTAQEPPLHTVRTIAEVRALPDEARRVRGIRLPDDAVAALARLRALEDLELLGAEPDESAQSPEDYRIGRAAFDALGDVVSLRRLVIGDAVDLPVAGLEPLAGIPLLAELRLDHVADLTDAHAGAIARLPSLRRLWIAGWGDLSDRGLAHLAQLPGLEELAVIGTYALSADGYRELAELRRLRRLDLSAPRVLADQRLRGQRNVAFVAQAGAAARRGGPGGVDDSVLEVIGQLPELRWLSLAFRADITDAGLRHLRGLEELEHLDLSACYEITDAGLRHLPASLRTLDLRACRQAGADFPAHLNALEWLDLNNNAVLTDEAVERICSFPRLRHLDLGGCAELTRACAEHLGRAQRLEYLSLRMAPWLDDEVVTHLARLGELRTLNLTTFDFQLGVPGSDEKIGGRSAITGAGVEQLARLEHLRELHLATMQPCSVARLRALRDLPLEQVDLRYNEIEYDERTPDLTALRALWPNAEIRWSAPRERER